jgi:DNA-binding CsgD family transcriptional regulator
MVDDPAARVASLTDREREVLALLARGCTNAEIAAALDVTFATAKSHVSAVLSKLGVESREEAAEIWHRIHRRPRPGRRFALAFVAAVVGAVVIGGAVALFARSNEPDPSLTVPLSDLTAGVPRRYTPDYLGSNPVGTHFGVWVVLQADGSVDAFYDRDPFSYCLANWLPDQALQRHGSVSISGGTVTRTAGAFRVGCTGWQFDIHGEYDFGAAMRGLDRFAVAVRDGVATIQLDKIELGLCDSGLEDAYPKCSLPGQPVVRAAPLPPTVPWYGMGGAVPSALPSP